MHGQQVFAEHGLRLQCLVFKISQVLNTFLYDDRSRRLRLREVVDIVYHDKQHDRLVQGIQSIVEDHISFRKLTQVPCANVRRVQNKAAMAEKVDVAPSVGPKPFL